MKPEYDHAISFLWVRDWERALRFYKDTLGFGKVFESDGWAEFKIPGVKDTFIAINRWASDTEMPKNNFITLRVLNLMEFKKYLETNGVHIKGKVDEFVDEGQGLRMFKFVDPDRNVLTAAQIDN